MLIFCLIKMRSLKHSKLLSLFKTLEKQEIRDFKKYLQSPFFNQREDVIQLFDYLLQQEKRKKKMWDKEVVFQKLYPKVTFDDHRIRMAISFLFRHLENFLVYQQLFGDPVKIKIALAQIYRKRSLPKHFHSTIQSTKVLQDKQPSRNVKYHNDQMDILLEEFQFKATYERTVVQNLQEISNTMDITFISLKLRQSCHSISHQSVYKTDYQFDLIADMLRLVEEKTLLDIPAIASYYYCYKAYRNPENIFFYEQLKKEILKNSKFFPASELRDLYLFTINFCIKRMNEGFKQFEKEALQLYQQGLQTGHLLENGMLSRFTYRNIVTMSLMVQDYEYAQQFIHEYYPHLSKTHQQSAYSFNLARLEYARKNYKTALTLLQKAAYKDLLLNLAAKTIALKIYYELHEFDLLESHIAAMTNFIRRKAIIGYHKQNYIQLLKFTKSLLELKPYDREAKNKLLKEIEESKIVAEKSWLRARIIEKW